MFPAGLLPSRRFGSARGSIISQIRLVWREMDPRAIRDSLDLTSRCGNRREIRSAELSSISSSLKGVETRRCRMRRPRRASRSRRCSSMTSHPVHPDQFAVRTPASRCMRRAAYDTHLRHVAPYAYLLRACSRSPLIPAARCVLRAPPRFLSASPTDVRVKRDDASGSRVGFLLPPSPPTLASSVRLPSSSPRSRGSNEIVPAAKDAMTVSLHARDAVVDARRVDFSAAKLARRREGRNERERETDRGSTTEAGSPCEGFLASYRQECADPAARIGALLRSSPPSLLPPLLLLLSPPSIHFDHRSSQGRALDPRGSSRGRRMTEIRPSLRPASLFRVKEATIKAFPLDDPADESDETKEPSCSLGDSLGARADPRSTKTRRQVFA